MRRIEMNPCQVSEMVELWNTRQITANELHQYLLDNIDLPPSKKVLLLMRDLLGDTITLKQFFDQAFQAANAVQGRRSPASKRYSGR